jgi:hypothetical protein
MRIEVSKLDCTLQQDGIDDVLGKHLQDRCGHTSNLLGARLAVQPKAVDSGCMDDIQHVFGNL